MPRVPRGLRNLNLEAESEESEQQDDDAQDPPTELDIGFPREMPAQNRSIKIICKNGSVRVVSGSFRTAELWGLDGGRVLVETDENGVPNQWSESILSSYLGEIAQNSSFAPLHIPRWDSKLFNGPKESIIKDVEKKFTYSAETQWFTRQWILKTVNKRWRDYKSDLKKEYFNPDKRTLVQIEKDVPDGVNENQWSSLLAIWCSDAHQKLCRKNSESGKKQRHPHTSGRKSHARLKKEMEDKKKGTITKIDLWDESHKKKNGNYVNQNVQILMDKAFDELENRRKDKGALSSTDYDDVFEKVIRKDLKVNGYYDDENWSNGPDSHALSEENKKLRRELELAISGFRDIRAFLEKKFPAEEWTSTKPATGSSKFNDTEDDENISKEYFNRSNYNIPSSPHNEQLHNLNCIAGNKSCSDPSVSNDNIVLKQSQVSSSSNGIQEHINTDEERTLVEPKKKHEKQKKSQQESPDSNYSNVNQEHSDRSLLRDEEMTLTDHQSKKQKENESEKNQKLVLLFSTRKRKPGQVVAIGNLISRDSTVEIGGTKLGEGYFAVAIHSLTNVENERLPRPDGAVTTIEDAIGMCVAWPCTHLKRVRPKRT